MHTRVVVVTGVSSGIGRASALRFAARGDRLALGARGAENLADVADRCRALGADVVALPTDVTRPDTVRALADAAVERFGRIDVWVDTAAVMAYGRFEDLPADVFDQVIRTNLLGSANVARVALRQFRRQSTGVLILAGSLLGHVAAPYMGAYVVGKWAHRALVRVLRQETRDASGIHVCLVSPGSVDTAIYRTAANYAGRGGRPPVPVDPPDKVGAAIVRLADRPRGEVSVGWTNRFIRLGFATAPPLYDALVGPLMRRLALSRDPMDAHDGNVFAPASRMDPARGRWARWGGRAAVGAVGLLALTSVARRGRR